MKLEGKFKPWVSMLTSEPHVFPIYKMGITIPLTF